MPGKPPNQQDRTVYQVNELVTEMRNLLELSYPQIWVEGELSSLSKPASGHLYFSLKDEHAQLRCAMFRNRASISKYRPQEGDLVRIRLKISVYNARGDLQAIVQHIEAAGEGLLQRQFEALKNKLDKKGWFAQARKKPIPAHPKRIGLVTSPSGAAIKDVLTTLKRRSPGIPITVYPAVVQGQGASSSIIEAIKHAQMQQSCDVLLLVRGGGSLEDLWCFNDEALAEHMVNCTLPIVSGVGHEVDFTIADLVADLRAPTPTAAAELVSADYPQLENQVKQLANRLRISMQRQLQRRAQTIDYTYKRLVHPGRQLQYKRQLLLQVQNRLLTGIKQQLYRHEQQYRNLQQRLSIQHPNAQISANQLRLSQLAEHLKRSQYRQLQSQKQTLQGLANQLHTVSPLATMQRGFSVTQTADKNIIRSSHQVSIDDTLTVLLASGEFDCTVTSTRHEKESD